MSIDGFAQMSASVFNGTGDPVVVSRSQIDSLIVAAREAPNGRARLLLHEGAEDNLHEMLIALPPDSCDHPHINYKSGKSFLALSGQFAVMHCSEDGSRIDASVLSAGAWPGAVICRLRKAAWHTIIPLAGDTVFLETIVGPFTGNYFADWFPKSEDRASHDAFVQRFRTLARAAADRLS
jgi:cupin fold WbuC family metalloprotein